MTLPGDILEKLEPGFNFQALASAVDGGVFDRNEEIKKKAQALLSQNSFAPVSTAVKPSEELPLNVQDITRHVNEGAWADNLVRAKEEMTRDGITGEQRKAYAGKFSDALYAEVRPIGYYEHGKDLRAAAVAVLLGSPHGELNHFEDEVNGKPYLKNRFDAWRFYLGIPQKYDTFGVSDYRPSKGTDKDKVYYKIKNFWQDFASFYQIDRPQKLKQFIEKIAQFGDGGDTFPEWDHTSYVMGNFILSTGKDSQGTYLSYYDKWDLDIPHGDMFGKPYELYDRIYYDPKTYKLLNHPAQEKK